MIEIEIFKNDEFGEVRAIEIDGEIWFVGKDVTEKLGYSNSSEAITDHVDEDDKLNSKMLSSFEIDLGQRGGWMINESGLYSLILSSKMENAKKFKHWITKDVLPAIRKNGAYIGEETRAEIGMMKAELKEVHKEIGELPLLAIECERITKAKNKKVVSLTGGKESKAYRDKHLRSRIYKDMNKQICREYGVSSYKAINRNRIDEVLGVVAAYQLPMCLKNEIEYANSQYDLGDYHG